MRGSGDRAAIVFGPATVTATLKTASARPALTRPGAPRVVTVAGAPLLCLPGGATGKWLPHPAGGVLVRAPTSATLPATHKALLAAEQALRTVAAWTPITDAWPVASAGYAMCAARGDGEFWSLPAPIPDGTYAVAYADAKAGRYPVQCCVFARSGAAVAEVVAGVRAGLGGATAPEAALPQASRAEIAAAKRQAWLAPAETSILLIDRAASAAWHGVFDARGRSAIARGAPCDFERIVGRAWIDVGAAPAHRALVLDGPAPTTWIAQGAGGALVRHLSGEPFASALGAAAHLADRRATWTPVDGVLKIGADGARLLDAAARGSKPRKRDVLEVALAPGRYRLARREADGAVGVAGEALEYRVELWRLTRA